MHSPSADGRASIWLRRIVYQRASKMSKKKVNWARFRLANELICPPLDGTCALNKLVGSTSLEPPHRRCDRVCPIASHGTVRLMLGSLARDWPRGGLSPSRHAMFMTLTVHGRWLQFALIISPASVNLDYPALQVFSTVRFTSSRFWLNQSMKLLAPA